MIRLSRGAVFIASLACGAVFGMGFSDAAWGGWAAFAALALQAALALSLARRSAHAGRELFLSQFVFGLGWFVPALHWTVESMYVHGRLPLWTAFLGLAVLGVVCALFTALPVAAGLRAVRREALRPVAWAALMFLGEWVRGDGLIHFPWLAPAYATLDTLWAGWAPLAGTQGASLAFLLAAAALAGAALGYACRAHLALFALIAATGAASLAHTWSVPAESVTVRLLQTNLPVVNGFVRADPLERVREAARGAAAPWPEEAESRRMVVTAEGMLTGAIERLPEVVSSELVRLVRTAGAPVLFNGFRATSEGYANTAFWMDEAGHLVGSVDKRRLVPFGEYVPAGFRWFVNLLGIPLSDLVEGAPVQPLLRVGGMPFGVLICYENADGLAVASSFAGGESPEFFVVTSNLGWFSPQVLGQHLRMTRFRALETARPFLSVNMNGRSAVVAADGRIEIALGSGAGWLDWTGRGALGAATPAVRAGGAPAVLAALLLFLGALLAGHARTSASCSRGGL